MENPKPILVPGHPADLLMAMKVAVASLKQLKADHPEDPPASLVRAHALALREALDMWLGERPVAVSPEVH